jgi:hypothetical protein
MSAAASPPRGHDPADVLAARLSEGEDWIAALATSVPPPASPLPRPKRIPEWAWEIADDRSDLTVYLWTSGAVFHLVLFDRRRHRVLQRGSFGRPDDRRWEALANLEDHRRRHADREWREAMAATPFAYAVGDMLWTATLRWEDDPGEAWFDESDPRFFEVVSVRGDQVTLREAAQVREQYDCHEGTDRRGGLCAPKAGVFAGPPVRRQAKAMIRLEGGLGWARYARVWAKRTVAGVPIGTPAHWGDRKRTRV